MRRSAAASRARLSVPPAASRMQHAAQSVAGHAGQRLRAQVAVAALAQRTRGGVGVVDVAREARANGATAAPRERGLKAVESIRRNDELDLRYRASTTTAMLPESGVSASGGGGGR